MNLNEALDMMSPTMPSKGIVVDTAGNPREVSKSILLLRKQCTDIIEAGGLTGIDYESAGEIQSSGGGKALPPAIWACETRREIDRILVGVYEKVTRQEWRVWSLRTRPDYPHKEGNLAAMEGVAPRTLAYMVERVDATIMEVLERRDWRIV